MGTGPCPFFQLRAAAYQAPSLDGPGPPFLNRPRPLTGGRDYSRHREELGPDSSIYSWS